MAIETELEINTFTGEMLPELGLANGIADLFQRGYPSMYPSDVRGHDLSRYRDGGDIISQIYAGNTWMVARSAGGGLVGILKYRSEVRRPDCPDPQSLLAWIITDPVDCRRGFGRRLIEAYHGNLIGGVGISPSDHVMSVADVMKSNAPSCRLFLSCGYEAQEGKGSDFLLMSKRLGTTDVQHLRM